MIFLLQVSGRKIYFTYFIFYSYFITDQFMCLNLVDLLMSCLGYISFNQKFFVSAGREGNTVANKARKTV